ncbi:hypothetical protein MKZ01_14045 [Lysinibacillus endophyticus]|uniref:hypothetical protein n=1 Tax=Ureibacillus endophyticus TaxID=1978490 RepID=UPI00313648EE
MKDNRNFNHEKEANKGRDQRNNDNNWIPERNVATGFPFKGFLILIGMIVMGSIIKFLFF